VLRDRQALATDGMIVVICQYDKKTSKLLQTPDILSRGFLHMKDNKEFIELTRKHLEKLLVDSGSHPLDPDAVKETVREELGKFLFVKTERRPMVLPVIIEV
jgi:ribonuclease J